MMFKIDATTPAVDQCNVDVVLARVCEITGDSYPTVRAALQAEPCRVKEMPASEITDISQKLGVWMVGECAWGSFIAPRLILVVRLDWPKLLAHELTHLVDYIMDRPPSEKLAQQVEDAI